jgi:hypothetical protein
MKSHSKPGIQLAGNAATLPQHSHACGIFGDSANCAGRVLAIDAGPWCATYGAAGDVRVTKRDKFDLRMLLPEKLEIVGKEPLTRYAGLIG